MSRVIYGLSTLAILFLFELCTSSATQMLLIVAVLVQCIVTLRDILCCIKYAIFQPANARHQMRLAIWGILVFVLLFPIARLGIFTRDALFLAELEHYNEAIAIIQNSIAPSETFQQIELPDQLKGLAIIVTANESQNKVLTVEFFTGGGFPLKHRGYLYRSDDNINENKELIKFWPYMRRLSPCWYSFSD